MRGFVSKTCPNEMHFSNLFVQNVIHNVVCAHTILWTVDRLSHFRKWQSTIKRTVKKAFFPPNLSHFFWIFGANSHWFLLYCFWADCLNATHFQATYLLSNCQLNPAPCERNDCFSDASLSVWTEHHNYSNKPNRQLWLVTPQFLTATIT